MIMFGSWKDAKIWNDESAYGVRHFQGTITKKMGVLGMYGNFDAKTTSAFLRNVAIRFMEMI